MIELLVSRASKELGLQFAQLEAAMVAKCWLTRQNLVGRAAMVAKCCVPRHNDCCLLASLLRQATKQEKATRKRGKKDGQPLGAEGDERLTCRGERREAEVKTVKHVQ